MNYRTLSQQQYENLRYEYLKQVEESGHENTLPYYDSNGLITIGVGFNLHFRTTLEEFLSVAMGITGANNISNYADRLTAVLNQYQLQGSGTASQTATMQQALDAEWASLTGIPGAQFIVTERAGKLGKRDRFIYLHISENKSVLFCRPLLSAPFFKLFNALERIA